MDGTRRLWGGAGLRRRPLRDGCIEAGQSTTLTAELMRSDVPRTGEVARIPVMLQHGPCGTEADGTRTMVGAVELKEGAATVWSEADLASRPDPFQ